MDVQLTFINNSDDENETNIVIFQKNAAHAAVEAVAWQVIRHCGPGSSHPFVVPRKFQLACVDRYGNYTPRMDISRASIQFEMIRTDQGDVLRPSAITKTDPLGNPMPGVLMFNRLDNERVVANVYKDNKLVASMEVEAGSVAGFEFAPAIYIGACPAGVSEGDALRAEQTWIIDNKLSLYHVASADIVMTGGGDGGAPLQFALENVVRN
jgi:hypothetical protein